MYGALRTSFVIGLLISYSLCIIGNYYPKNIDNLINVLIFFIDIDNLINTHFFL